MVEIRFQNITVCPACGGELNTVGGDLTCRKCSKQFSVKDDILLLSKDVYGILSEVELRRNQKPGWYEGDQLSMDGPYRHSLQKRKAFLRGIIHKITNGRESILLDAGCGDGFVLKSLMNYTSIEFLGVDFNLTRLHRARRILGGRVKLILADLREKIVKDSSIDIIICNQVLEHIQEDEMILANFYNYLKPGGFLILSVPQEGAFLWKLRNNFIQPSIGLKTDHVHFYTSEEVEKKLVKTGFRNVRAEFFSWGIPFTYMDTMLRQFKPINDLIDFCGRRILEKQAIGLFFFSRK